MRNKLLVTTFIGWIALLVVITVTACKKNDDGAEVLKVAQKIFGTIPQTMPGSENDNADLIALGKKLYHEPKLSANDTQSCSSCHQLENKMAGVDNNPTSKGAFGKNGGRNSPTTLNAGFHVAQFWDGRAPDLVAQAKGPFSILSKWLCPASKLLLPNLSHYKNT